jgi:HK97 family phage portal protein
MGGLFAALAGGGEAKLDLRQGLVEIWRDLFGGVPVKSGVSVTWKTALQVTTVKACVSRIAEALMCPMKLYIRNTDGSRSEARDHPLYALMADAPNSLQSGLEYRETIGLHSALMFNHYSYISRAGGKIKELIPIMPGSVKTSTDDLGGLTYEIRWPSGRLSSGLKSEEVWHVRGPSWDGAVGMDAIYLLREAIGLAIATEETHSRFHSNGAQPGGYLTTDKDLSDQTIRDRLKEQFSQTIAGVANKFKTIVLDNGLKWEPMTATGVDSQHLQLRQFQVEEICRGYNVMPIMVGYSGDKAPTFASAEQPGSSSLRPPAGPRNRPPPGGVTGCPGAYRASSCAPHCINTSWKPIPGNGRGEIARKHRVPQRSIADSRSGGEPLFTDLPTAAVATASAETHTTIRPWLFRLYPETLDACRQAARASFEECR